MSIEIVLQTASVAASVVGIAASLLTFFKAKGGQARVARIAFLVSLTIPKTHWIY